MTFRKSMVLMSFCRKEIMSSNHEINHMILTSICFKSLIGKCCSFVWVSPNMYGLIFRYDNFNDINIGFPPIFVTGLFSLIKYASTISFWTFKNGQIRYSFQFHLWSFKFKLCNSVLCVSPACF